MYCNGIQSYRKTDISTSDPGKLVILCYEGAIDSLKLAKEKIKEQEYEKKAKAINKAKDFINELLCSLNYEKGGEIATNLRSIYNYMLRKVFQADINRDIRAIDEVVGMLNELLSAWQEVASRPVNRTQPTMDGLEEKRVSASGHISV